MNSWSLIIIDLMMDKIDFHFKAIKSWIIHIDNHDTIFFYSLQSQKANYLCSAQTFKLQLLRLQ